jgi:hypothetical protein
MRRFLQIALLSVAGAFVCAFLFIVALHWSLPSTDAAYGVPLFTAVWDPLVLGAAVLFGVLSGLITTPLAYYCLRGRRILPCTALVFVAVAAEIIAVTPVARAPGFFGAFAVLVASLLYCRHSKRPMFLDSTDSTGRRRG